MTGFLTIQSLMQMGEVSF